MDFDKCGLSKIVGDINFDAAKKELKKENYETGHTNLYFAKIFYTFCENVNGIRKCNDLMDILGIDTEEIKHEMGGQEFNAMGYVDNYLNWLYELLSEEVKAEYFIKNI